MGIDRLFSLQVSDADWVKNAASCILRVLGPERAEWWAADWELTSNGVASTALAADSAIGALMESRFPATTHADLPQRLSRDGGFTTVTAAGLWTESARDLFGDMRRQDAVAITMGQSDRGFVVGRLLRKRAPHPPGDRRVLAPVVRSVNAAWRVRKYLAQGRRDEVAEAIFHPSGKVLHAIHPASRGTSLQLLRAAVVAREKARRAAGQSVAGAAVWSQLVEGRWSLVDDHEERGQRYIVAVRNDAYADAAALTEREALAVDAAVRGYSAKQSVDTLGVSLSAVYALRTSAVKKLSARSLADVVTLGRQLRGVVLKQTALGDAALMALRMPVTVGCLSGLTCAEREVAGSLLQGLPQREIARRRGRSLRTIANQVASVYQKVGVSGRTDFVAFMRGGAAPSSGTRRSR